MKREELPPRRAPWGSNFASVGFGRVRRGSPSFWAAIAVVALSSCTDASVYSSLGGEPILPDRVMLTGELCTEDASGDRFPVKVLFVVDSSTEMFTADPGGARFNSQVGGINLIVNQNLLQPHVRFGFVGIAAGSTAYPTPNGQRFFEPQAPEVPVALTQLQAPLGNQRDILNALNQVEAFIFKDIASSSPGEIVRSRYLVSMLFAGRPTPNMSVSAIREHTEGLVRRVYEQGVLEVRINTGLVYFGPRTIDIGPNPFNCYVPGGAEDPLCACSGTVTGDANYCAAYCALTAPGAPDYEANMTAARSAYEAIATAGAGLFRQFPCPQSINLRVNIASAGVELVKKDIVAFNRNVRLTPDGPLIDSDGDGLTDLEERQAVPPTSPLTWDTDGDGLGDRVEFRTFPRQSPVNPNDRPASCIPPDTLGAMPDRDIDLLNDCEEGLLQTSPTVPDTDGDGLPDLLEFLSGTIPIAAIDRLLDFDNDGVPNAAEVLAHTDPRSADGVERGRHAYRNDITPLGLKKVATMAPTPLLPGVNLRRSSSDLLGGQAFLQWNGCTNSLSFSDTRWPAGIPAFEPIPVNVPASGIYTATARAPNGVEIWAEFHVIREFMPPCSDGVITASPLISVSDRNCYDVQISNIKLMHTLAANGRPEPGRNEILVFFTQAPAERLTSPGVSKVAQIDVDFTCTDPAAGTGCERSPNTPIITLTDDIFVTALP